MNQKNLAYYSFRGIILIVITVIASVLYEYFIYPQKLKTEGWLESMVASRIQEPADIIYFSASPNHAIAPNDKNTASIADIIQWNVSDQHVAVIDTGGLHAGVYLEILKRLPEEKLPKQIVMNLNLRSFGTHWIYSNLETSLQRNLAYWNNRPGIINHINIALKNYNYTSPEKLIGKIEYQKRLEKLPFSENHSTINRWVDSLRKENPSNKMGQLMVENFGFVIKEDNKMLSYFSEIVAWTKKKKIPIVFVILPEDIEGMSVHVDQQLVDLVVSNKLFLLNYFSDQNIPVIDLCEELDASHFFDAHPTEHYNFQGREYVGQRIASFLNSKSIKNGN